LAESDNNTAEAQPSTDAVLQQSDVAPQQPQSEVAPQEQRTAAVLEQPEVAPQGTQPEAALEQSGSASTEPQPEVVAQPPQVPPRRPFVPREERDRRRREALASLTVGEWREGKVTSVVPFGAFVDIGGIDGLVHISQLGVSGYVEKAENVVQPGQTVRVRVVEVDAERQRIGLSMREPNAARAPRPASTERGPSQGGFSRPPAGNSSFSSPSAPPSSPAGGTGEQSDEQSSGRRPERSRSGSGSGGGNRNEQFRNNENRPRTPRKQEDTEEWRPVRGGDARDYYAIFDDEGEGDEVAPTTAEELVARFNKSRK